MEDTQLILSVLNELKDDIKSDMAEVKSHLDTLNGRTRKVEVAVELHSTFWKIFGAIFLALIPIATYFLR